VLKRWKRRQCDASNKWAVEGKEQRAKIGNAKKGAVASRL
jgi:hypothetical protein